jgi:hypothetical protein
MHWKGGRIEGTLDCLEAMRNGTQVVTTRHGEQNANTGKVVAMASQKCTVTIGGLGDPAEHVVTVEGDTLYEAAVRGWKALREGRWSGDDASGTGVLVVTVQPPPVVHRVKVTDLRAWLDGGGKSPADRMHRQRLKALLEDGK